MSVRIALKLNPSGYIILITLTLLMKIVRSFVWRKFSSVGREEWYEKMTNGQKIKLGDAHVTPKKYPRSTSVKAWGCPTHPHLHQQKYQVFFQDTIFLFLHMICVILGASFYFAFIFVFCLLVINGGIRAILFGEKHTPFSLFRTL